MKGISDAEVVAISGDVETRATSDVGGQFELVVPAEGMIRLTIRARDHLPYAELLAPDSGEMDYDMLPARVEDRVRAGLSALLIGTVVDQGGTPAPGVSVRLQPDRPELPPIQTDRRVLDGGVLAPPLTTTSDAAGAFRLETAQQGSGRLFVLDDGSQPAGGLALVVRRGEVLEGLRLVTRKKP